MSNLNPAGADTRLLVQSGYPAANCLHQCAIALGAIPSLVGTVLTSRVAWGKSTSRHTGYPTMLGTPVFFSGAGGDWDTALWHGNGTVVGVDVGKPGHSGVQMVAQRAAQVGGAYQGFVLDFLGYGIVGDSAAGTGTLVPITEDEMGFSFVKDAQAVTVFVVSLVSGNRAAIQSEYHMGLLQRLKANDGSDPMLQAELDICKGYLVAINPPPVVVAPTIPPITISPDSIEAGVKAAFAGGMSIAATKGTLIND